MTGKFNLDNFYQSKEWRMLLKNIKALRIGEDGNVRCSRCQKIIGIKAKDIIGHHTVELTESNVNDYNVSLNPELIELLCTTCHNQEHKKLQRKLKGVYIIYGPPCAGKTTYVKENATSKDLVIDIDKIWKAISVNGDYEKPKELIDNVFTIRDSLIDMVRMRRGRWESAFIIGGYPMQTERERLKNILNAEEILILEDKNILYERAKDRPKEWKKYIDNWFDEYS